MSPAERFPRGAEVIERLRLAGYVPQIVGRRFFVKKGPYNRDKVAYAKWIDCLNNPEVRKEAINYMRLTIPHKRRKR